MSFDCIIFLKIHILQVSVAT